MATRTDILVVSSSVVVAVLLRRRKRRNRKVWVKEWIQQRQRQGAYHQLMQELRCLDVSSYRNFVRMDATTFENLLCKVAPLITYKDTNMREAICPGERLALTLRFLATGETYESLKYLYRVAAQTIGKIIPETCHALVEVLKDQIEVPKSAQQWQEIAQQFAVKWDFYHCIGAMDGKHILIRPPPNSGSYYFNYKHHFSVVLLAVVDANYRFIYVDIGCNGRISDGGVLKNSSLNTALEENTLDIPLPKPLPHRKDPIPYFLVADDAFPLKEYIMKPYSQTGLTPEKRIFNYRLSRARRIVENAFGILSNRFRLFMTPIRLVPEKVEVIVMACCSLHNYLRNQACAEIVYTPNGSFDAEDPLTHEVEPGHWRQESEASGWVSLQQQGSNRYSFRAKEIRDKLCDYFVSEDGELTWQNNMI